MTSILYRRARKKTEKGVIKCQTQMALSRSGRRRYKLEGGREEGRKGGREEGRKGGELGFICREESRLQEEHLSDSNMNMKSYNTLNYCIRVLCLGSHSSVIPVSLQVIRVFEDLYLCWKLQSKSTLFRLHRSPSDYNETLSPTSPGEATILQSRFHTLFQKNYSLESCCSDSVVIEEGDEEKPKEFRSRASTDGSLEKRRLGNGSRWFASPPSSSSSFAQRNSPPKVNPIYERRMSISMKGSSY
ncbi:unnamed protein product [Darwinula stevensoni]|uniref:Uncharacterized protein n=1 Tax=Darwinula stevensoni TaxID=69355 RepID=A0A7R9AEX2_9CRUS|nr:unnamed protein product [Darwinula stevensoni]CAG0902467.1 unnamed protein product [Darwinula stevensoni]